MREIKHRGIAEHSGVMIFGFYTQGCFDGISKSVPHGISQSGCYPVSVIKETVGQLTGIKDSYGVDIYEGDIVHIDYVEYRPSPFNIDSFTGIVKFIDGSFVVEKNSDIGDFLFQEIALVKVLGNIHKNPELIGE